MKEHSPHKTPEKSKKIARYVFIGLSLISIISCISLPWRNFTAEEVKISLFGLLFINFYLVWSYCILFVWRQHILDYLEQKYKVKIVAQLAGSYSIVGDIPLLKKLTVFIQVFLYFFLGMLFPFALFLIGILCLR